MDCYILAQIISMRQVRLKLPALPAHHLYYFGSYQAGGHTQNSVYNDDGTFWYSNDPAGVKLCPSKLTPEMTF
jgi:hypothetical protein